MRSGEARCPTCWRNLWAERHTDNVFGLCLTPGQPCKRFLDRAAEEAEEQRLSMGSERTEVSA